MKTFTFHTTVNHDRSIVIPPEVPEGPVEITIQFAEPLAQSKESAKVGHSALLERIAELRAGIPPEELARIPRDFAANLDHYLHGSPKEEEG